MCAEKSRILQFGTEKTHENANAEVKSRNNIMYLFT